MYFMPIGPSMILFELKSKKRSKVPITLQHDKLDLQVISSVHVFKNHEISVFIHHKCISKNDQVTKFVFLYIYHKNQNVLFTENLSTAEHDHIE